MENIEFRLQRCLNKVETWATKNGFKFSKTKTQCVHFCQLRGLHPDPVLNNAPCHPGGRNRWLLCACSRWVRPPLYNAAVRYTVPLNSLKQQKSIIRSLFFHTYRSNVLNKKLKFRNIKSQNANSILSIFTISCY